MAFRRQGLNTDMKRVKTALGIGAMQLYKAVQINCFITVGSILKFIGNLKNSC